MDERDNIFEREIVDADEENNLDVEIVNLDEDASFSKQKAVSSSAKHTSFVPRFTLQQRRIQLVVTVNIVCMLLFVLLSSYTPVRTRIVQALIPPTLSIGTKAGPETELFYFDANPTWGHLFVDGKIVKHLPSIGNRGDAPLKLVGGRHMLRWVATPFAPQQCTVSVPFNTVADTCHFDQFTQYPKGIGAWLFRFPVSLAQLPQTAFSTLVTTVQAELDMHAPRETVMPGEIYAVNTTGESIQRATKPLRATLHYQLDVENNLDGVCSTLFEESTPCTFNGQACYLFCTVPMMTRELHTTMASWDVFAAVQASWDYRTADGTLLAQNQPELLGTSVVYDHLLPLHITWDGTTWHVALLALQASSDVEQQLNVACNTALNTVKSVLVPSSSEQAHSGINWHYVSGTNPAAGCLGMATLNEGQGTHSPPPVAYCLHRFGVFLAANAVAHHYWPNMPVANAYEQQLTQKLATSQNDS